MKSHWKTYFCVLSILAIITACTPPIKPSVANKPPAQNLIEESITPNPDELTQTDKLAPDTQTSEEIFSEVAEGRIPVIYSHGGGPCDIGGMVFFNKHPQVDLIGMVLSRGEFYPQVALKKWPVFLFDVLKSNTTENPVTKTLYDLSTFNE